MRLLNESLEPIGKEIDLFISSSGNLQYYNYGDFELLMPLEYYDDNAAYVYNTDFNLQTKDDKGQFYVPEAFREGLCGRARFNAHTDTDPLANGTHNIACLLPPVCDRDVANDCNDATGAKSCFVYRINQASAGRWSSMLPEEGRDKILNTDWTTEEGVYDKDAPKNASAGKTWDDVSRCAVWLAKE